MGLLNGHSSYPPSMHSSYSSASNIDRGGKSKPKRFLIEERYCSILTVSYGQNTTVFLVQFVLLS